MRRPSSPRCATQVTAEQQRATIERIAALRPRKPALTRKKISANPNITYVETEDGGHCSFLADRDGYDGHWAERQVVEYLRRF